MFETIIFLRRSVKDGDGRIREISSHIPLPNNWDANQSICNPVKVQAKYSHFLGFMMNQNMVEKYLILLSASLDDLEIGYGVYMVLEIQQIVDMFRILLLLSMLRPLFMQNPGV